MARRKNPFGKSRDITTPYAIYKGYGPFGDTEVRVLKTYSHPEIEQNKPYARWFVAVSSDFTFGSFDLGDSYIREAIYGLVLVESTKEWEEYYNPTQWSPPLV